MLFWLFNISTLSFCFTFYIIKSYILITLLLLLYIFFYIIVVIVVIDPFAI